MMAPIGTVNLIVDCEIEDSKAAHYEIYGDGLIRVIYAPLMRTSRNGQGYVELQNPDGVIIAATQPVELDRRQHLVLSGAALRPIIPVQVK